METFTEILNKYGIGTENGKDEKDLPKKEVLAYRKELYAFLKKNPGLVGDFFDVDFEQWLKAAGDEEIYNKRKGEK